MKQKAITTPEKVVVSGGPMATANAIASMQKPVQPQMGSAWTPTVAGAFYSGNGQGGTYVPPTEPVRSAPTVATKSQPVISKTFTNNLQYDDTNPEDYLMRLNARVTATGKKPSEDEYYNALKAQQAISSRATSQTSTSMSQTGTNAYQSQIDALNAQKAQAEAEYKAQNEQAISAYKTAEQSSYEANKTALEQSGQKELSAAQNVYSFSGFGRSTAAADKASEIQAKTNAAVENARLAMEAQVALKKAELEGAPSAMITALNEQISQYTKAATDSQIESIKATQEANSKAGNDYITSLNNLMTAANKSGIDVGNPGDLQKYAQMARNADGTINEEFIKSLPENAQALIRSAASTSSQTEPAKTISIGSGKNERVLQWNSQTGKYDIPVGGGYVGGGVGGGGTGGGGIGGGGAGAGGDTTNAGINYEALNFKNQDQANAFAYVSRMLDTENIFKTTEPIIAGTNTTKGFIERNSPSFLQSDTFRQQEQAERNFINAALRRESGAAIAPSEFESARKQYLPQPGDDKKTLQQKQQNRATVMMGLASATGTKNAAQILPVVRGVVQKPQDTTNTAGVPTTPASSTTSGKSKALSLMD